MSSFDTPSKKGRASPRLSQVLCTLGSTLSDEAWDNFSHLDCFVPDAERFFVGNSAAVVKAAKAVALSPVALAQAADPTIPSFSPAQPFFKAKATRPKPYESSTSVVKTAKILEAEELNSVAVDLSNFMDDDYRERFLPQQGQSWATASGAVEAAVVRAKSLCHRAPTIPR